MLYPPELRARSMTYERFRPHVAAHFGGIFDVRFQVFPFLHRRDRLFAGPGPNVRIPFEHGWAHMAHDIKHDGFSRLGLSDHQLLDHEFIMYDALYAECKHRSGSGAAPS